MNYGLLLTFIIGFFIMIGAFIVFKTKNSEKIINFSISIALGVMASLCLLELIPESFEYFRDDFTVLKSIILLVSSAFIGCGILKVLDHFIPDHESTTKKKKDQEENLLHIGIVSSIAFVIHNVIEGMALYTATIADTKVGLLMCIGIALHNIPMGMVITSTFETGNYHKKETILWLIFISLSTFLGGLIMFLGRNSFIAYSILGILLGVTLGMLFYIVLFELLPKVKETRYKKDTAVGISLGVLLLLISKLL